MRKLLLAPFLFLIATLSVSAQNVAPQARTVFPSVVIANQPGTNEIGNGIQYHQLVWTISGGTAPTCQIRLMGSADNITFGTTIIAAQACTANGASTVAGIVVSNFVRIEVTTKSGVGTVTGTYLGWVANPAGSGGGTPGGSNTQVQFNNAGAFGGIPTSSFAANTLTFTAAADNSIPLTILPNSVNQTAPLLSLGAVSPSTTDRAVLSVTSYANTGGSGISLHNAGEVASPRGTLLAKLADGHFYIDNFVGGSVKQSMDWLSDGSIDLRSLGVNGSYIDLNGTTGISRFGDSGSATLTVTSLTGTVSDVDILAGTSGASGRLCFDGFTSGKACMSVPSVAGTPNTILFPTTTGTSGQVLSTNGANPQQTSWITPASSTAFSALTSGTNTTAAMVVGTGASFGISTPAAASFSPLQLTGAPFSGGTGTTTFPFFYLNQNATPVSTWSTSGTMFGISLASGFVGNLMDFHFGNGTSVFTVGDLGAVHAAGSVVSDGSILADQGALRGGAILTTVNCADSAGPAACGNAAAGAVVVDVGATTVVVSTTMVTANSEIFVSYDSSLSTRLGITCSAAVFPPTISARVAGTSFTITIPAAPSVNPACISYFIVN